MSNEGRAEHLAKLLEPVMRPGETVLVMAMEVDGEDVECDVVSVYVPPEAVSHADIAEAVCDLAAAMSRALMEGGRGR